MRVFVIYAIVTKPKLSIVMRMNEKGLEALRFVMINSRSKVQETYSELHPHLSVTNCGPIQYKNQYLTKSG